MLNLKRHVGSSVYILDQNDNDRIVLELLVTHVDDNGEYVKIQIKDDDDVRMVKLSNETELYDINNLPLDDEACHKDYDIDGIVHIYFRDIYRWKDRLQANIGFETSYKVIRNELLNSNSPVKITGRTKAK